MSLLNTPEWIRFDNDIPYQLTKTLLKMMCPLSS